MTDTQRVKAFEDCLLNTCVRAVRGAFEGLTLSNCLESEDFRAGASYALHSPFFARPVEPAMEKARRNLIERIESRS